MSFKTTAKKKMNEMAATNYCRAYRGPKAESRLIGSTSILSAVFDAIDQNIFNCNLDGVKLEWCETLKSRAAVTYQQNTFANKQVYIRCSKPYLKDYRRKQFMEVILYEMLCLYMNISTVDKMPDGLQMHLLKGAIDYLNHCFETDLKINNNYGKDNNTSDVKEILNYVAAERRVGDKKPLIDGFKATPGMQILTRKLFGNSEDFECKQNCGLCYCEPAIKFRQHFNGVNIYAIYPVREDVKCLLCEKEVARGSMEDHLDCDCFVFKPLGAPNFVVELSGFETFRI
ncbi:uncharacterized protein LOC129576301 [Sitodiplosis mosellana]|uniref:uncharacterized protein LOC129576301 n=1 Tax=Sitodiplosis mosellana TaxID=263140 RepID=UPI002444D14A|nr:uncharacterized protein LOC129576301 [Sitodiplosis mosellana]